MEVEEYQDVGNHSRKITTKLVQAQIYCNRALIQMFGFCYPEAIRLFQKALEFDENTPFALWGISYSYGPEINFNDLPEEYYQNGYEAYLKALKKIEYANEWEKDLIDSLKFRYPKEIPKTFEQKIEVIRNYRKEFRKIYEKYPDDLDIVSFYIESIISIHRTMLWNLDKSPTPEVLEAKEILERVSKLGYHPHICHLLIHTLEHHPVYYKDALESAELLSKNVRGVGHLLHMPSHIFILFGRYRECIELGKNAVDAEKSLKNSIGKYNLYTIYMLHDKLYVVFSSMFAADYETALSYALIIKEEIDDKLIDMFFPYIEWYYSTYFHVYIRFGKWDAILSEEIIRCDKYPITRTIQRYARTIAYAVKDDVKASEIEFNLFQKERESISKVAVIGNNPAEVVLEIGYHMALGELLYRKKDYEIAFNYLRESVKLCDQLKFSEPWDWMQPPRHALAALLLEQDHIEESIKVYLDDLAVYPDNIWSLTGLEECHTKLRLKLIEDAEVEHCENELKDIKRKLSKAKYEAGIIIKASCYCKKTI
jgi:tetratricopeptide (TPR) repeat protein